MRGVRARVLTAVLLAIGSSVVPACGSDDAPATTGVDLSGKPFEDRTGSAVVEIDAVDNAFRPAYVEISPGTTVTFTNRGRTQHNVLPVAEGAFDPIEVDELEPGTSRSLTFDEPGDYPYYCSLHGTTTKGMVGAIRVVG